MRARCATGCCVCEIGASHGIALISREGRPVRPFRPTAALHPLDSVQKHTGRTRTPPPRHPPYRYGESAESRPSLELIDREVASDRRGALRTTESPLELPTLGRACVLLGRVLRLRCPHCGRGAVLTRRASVHRRCAACGLRFERSDDGYFSGAMYFGLMMGETVFGLALLVTMLASWPDVPWDALTYIAPIGMIVVMLLLIPFSKVVWLAVDILVRPVTAAELLSLDP